MPKPVKCGICSKKFADKYNLSSHMHVHTSDTPFACPQCPYRGKTKKYLARHTKQVHKEKKREHKCNVCGKFFLHPSNLKVHAMVHSGEKPHSCQVCGKSFRVTYSLNSHMLIHANEKPFQCSFCDYACRDSSTLRKHQNKHMGLEKIYECKICNKGYKMRAALKVHIGETHLDVDMRKFPCAHCDKVFKSKWHRNTHVRSIHERSLVCNCPICGRRLMNKNNLPAHMRTHLDDRPFSCVHPGCKISFKDKNSLTKHAVIHEPSLHFPCQYCSRKFARKAHARRHERVMHEERRRGLECHYCAARFYSKNYLIKHIQTKHVHKEKFKYICDICGLVTHNKPSIVMHLKYGHANDHDMQCKICDNNLIYKRHIYLKLHYWNTHNIRYKITRKNTRLIKKEKDKSAVEIKVEPIEADSYEGLQLLDVRKHETQDVDDESIDYSRRVLSEDIAESVLCDRAHTKEVEFDEFFIRHVFTKQEEKRDEEDKNCGVNKEQNERVKERIKKILKKTQKLEQAKALREKRKREEVEKKEREIEEAKMRVERERVELVELRRVREMYNRRMNAALVKEKTKKEQVKIKYFKKVLDKNIKITEVISGNVQTATHDNPIEIKDLSDNQVIEDNIKTHSENDNIDVQQRNSNDKIETSSEILKNDVNGHKSIDNSEDETENHNIDVQNAKIIQKHQSNYYTENNSEISNNYVHEHTGIDNSEDENQNQYIDTQIHQSNDNIENNIEISNNDVQELISNDNIDLINVAMNDINEVIDNNNISNDNIDDNNTATNDINEASDNNNIAVQELISNNDIDYNNSATNDSNDNIDLNNTASSPINEANDNNNIAVQELISNDKIDDNNSATDDDITTDKEDILDQPLLERRVRRRKSSRRKKPRDKSDSDESWNDNDDDVTVKAKKMEFKTFQCYVCFKLYSTKQDLVEHCQEHFDICHERTLTKCPMCSHVTPKGIVIHMKRKHNVTITIPYNKLIDGNSEGSGYCYDANGTTVEVIPSVRTLNKAASDEIDKKRRDKNDKTIAKAKLIKKGNEWIVEKEAVDIVFDEIPELSDKDLHKCKITENDVDRLGQLGSLARKKGLKMMFPCFQCDKICQSFSALKLHKRRHEDNPKPFRPRIKKVNKKVDIKKVKLNKDNRTALPKPIVNKHKCDAKLKEFFESNIRGKDVEFWQFLKIFNKMDRAKVKDFNDLEKRSDFGNHLDYYKDMESDDEEIEDM